MKKAALIAAVTIAALAGIPSRSAHALGTGTKGNLSVELVDGSLFVFGDREANGILLSQFEGQILVGGHGDSTLFPWIPIDGFGSSTTVNGVGSIFVDASLVQEVVVIAGGGADDVVLRGRLTPDLFIDSGADRDLVAMPLALVNEIENAIEGDIHVNTGQDQDLVVLFSTHVAGNAHISTGHGQDQVRLAEVVFENDLAVNMGAHDDLFLAFSGNVVVGNLDLALGQGNDRVRVPGPALTIGGLGFFDGGQGVDWIDAANIVIDPANLEIINFELP